MSDDVVTYININGVTIDANGVETPPRKFRDYWKLEGGVVSIDQTKLPEAKEKAKTKVDTDAEAQRLLYITPGSGQAMTYRQKLEEAWLVANGESNAAVVPVLAASVGIEANTLEQCATLVISTYQMWQVVANGIETVRLGAKKDITDAETIEAVDAVVEAIEWPTFG